MDVCGPISNEEKQHLSCSQLPVDGSLPSTGGSYFQKMDAANFFFESHPYNRPEKCDVPDIFNVAAIWQVYQKRINLNPSLSNHAASCFKRLTQRR